MGDLPSGVLGLNRSEARSYREFWPYYLSQHLHPMTQRVHAVATTVAVATGLVGLTRRRPKLLAVAPLVAFGPAFAAHLAWEGNRPVAVNVLWAALADVEMVLKVFTGKIGEDTAAVRVAAGLERGEVTLADRRRRLGEAAGYRLSLASTHP